MRLRRSEPGGPGTRGVRPPGKPAPPVRTPGSARRPPPSTRRSPSSRAADRRNATTAATSSGRPKRPPGDPAAARSLRCPRGRPAGGAPIHRRGTRWSPARPSSRGCLPRRDRARAPSRGSAPLPSRRCTRGLRPPRAPRSSRSSTMAPPPRRLSSGATRRLARSAGKRFRSSTARKSSSSALRDAARSRAADVVHEEIDAAEPLDRRSRRAPRRPPPWSGRRGGRGAGPDRQPRAHGASRRAALPARAHRDAHALAGELERDGAPDPAAPAGDDRDLASQPEVHAKEV